MPSYRLPPGLARYALLILVITDIASKPDNADANSKYDIKYPGNTLLFIRKTQPFSFRPLNALTLEIGDYSLRFTKTFLDIARPRTKISSCCPYETWE
jgi:hypothetical protein